MSEVVTDKLVTRNTVEEWLSGDLNTTVRPYPIEGIPEGFAFFRSAERPIDDLIHKGYLMAFTPGYRFNQTGACAYKPVVVKKTDPPEVVEQEFKNQSLALLELFKENLKNINKHA